MKPLKLANFHGRTVNLPEAKLLSKTNKITPEQNFAVDLLSNRLKKLGLYVYIYIISIFKTVPRMDCSDPVSKGESNCSVELGLGGPSFNFVGQRPQCRIYVYIIYTYIYNIYFFFIHYILRILLDLCTLCMWIDLY